MKKIGLFALLCLALSAYAQQADNAKGAPEFQGPQGTIPTNNSFPIERIQTPTNSDLYCSGFLSKDLVADTTFVAGGLNSPSSTKFANGDIIYLAGSGYQAGSEYSIVRELRDPNRYENYAGQFAAISAAGHPYSDVARVRVIDTRSKMAVAQIEFACDTVSPGDVAMPFVEKPQIAFHSPLRFDRFIPPSNKVSGRIVMARDFDSVLGTGMKVYMNVGSNQGVKIGDYFRAVRSYNADLKDAVDSLSFKASTNEDTQKRPPQTEPNFMSRGKGAKIFVEEFPRRAVAEIVVLGVTPTTATGMIVYSAEDVHVGDGVEVDDQIQQAQAQ